MVWYLAHRKCSINADHYYYESIPIFQNITAQIYCHFHLATLQNLQVAFSKQTPYVRMGGPNSSP